MKLQTRWKAGRPESIEHNENIYKLFLIFNRYLTISNSDIRGLNKSEDYTCLYIFFPLFSTKKKSERDFKSKIFNKSRDFQSFLSLKLIEKVYIKIVSNEFPMSNMS